MKPRTVLGWGLGAVVAGVAIAAGAIASLPPTSAVAAAPPIAPEEADATVAALAPPKRARPLVAIIGLNDATETTDYLMPYGILRRSGVVEVKSLSTGPGPVRLYPALSVEADATVAQFDAQHPQGADYVIVPAMSRDDDPAALAWIRGQAAKGAIVIGVCAGAKVVGAAGLLDGKRGTTHWYYLDDLRERAPTMRYVADRRFVVDGRVATTTGISASMPMSLTLIEAIAGRDKAAAVAHDLGLATWDARHVSAGFEVTRAFASTVIGNRAAFWRHERLGIEVAPGIDEVSLALVADAWSRTYRSKVVTFAASASAIETRHGVRLVPDRVADGWPAPLRATGHGAQAPAKALSDALAGIEDRYGANTAALVAMQLELVR